MGFFGVEWILPGLFSPCIYAFWLKGRGMWFDGIHVT